ncbi:protoporphyrinogen oxidase HemJ [Emcibacter sp. SYSU 3D8]|uniref:protoporphyrinogen oxidase HemJ n=1 Tax=Emcibacter sp. SYSU 3D8 TaxID=3133969 RepID=UPI0031FF26C1
MPLFLAEIQPWLLALHIIAVIAWMAGMLYLPRLFVYHSGTMPGSEASEIFKVMERRLLKAIINPAMIVAFILGVLLLWASDWTFLKHGWMHGKLALVFLMFGVHGVMAGHVRRFREDQRARTARYYRVMNEIPTVLMIGIVLLVVVGSRT